MREYDENNRHRIEKFKNDRKKCGNNLTLNIEKY